jgi:hypothetical protein
MTQVICHWPNVVNVSFLSILGGKTLVIRPVIEEDTRDRPDGHLKRPCRAFFVLHCFCSVQAGLHQASKHIVCDTPTIDHPTVYKKWMV